METINLWNNISENDDSPTIDIYVPKEKKSDTAVVIFPGGAYFFRAEHEGKGYAEFLADLGITCFVVQYRVFPHTFPKELLDARRAICYVRANAQKYGIDKNKIVVMGSSAGGHLAALVSTYTKELEAEMTDEIDGENYLPNATVLCYPVIVNPDKNFSHKGSYLNLIGGENKDLAKEIDPLENITTATPPTFIWHTFDDATVNVKNSLVYAERLKDFEIPTELHIFPKGKHGVGLAKDNQHLHQWVGLFINWLKEIGF